MLNVYSGTPYEMGYAQGELLKDDATTFINAVWTYLEQQVVISLDQRSSRGV